MSLTADGQPAMMSHTDVAQIYHCFGNTEAPDKEVLLQNDEPGSWEEPGSFIPDSLHPGDIDGSL